MPTLEPLIPHAIPFLLVLFRVLGLFVFTPLLSSASLPRQIRVVLAMTFAASVYPMVPESTLPAELDLLGLVPLLISETMVGVVIGLIAQIPLAAIQMGGYIMGHQMALAIARSYNPELDEDSSAIGQLLFFLGAMIFLALGGLDIIFIALAETFRTLPIGGLSTSAAPLELFTALLDSSFDFALRVSMPVSAVVGLILIAIGFVMKTMPQINVMSVGFAIKILSGLAAMVASAYVINEATGDQISAVLSAIRVWAVSPGGAGG